MTPVMLEESKNGSMFMFIKRADTPAVLPLWDRVLMTRCPVNPACTAMWAVSGSRMPRALTVELGFHF